MGEGMAATSPPAYDATANPDGGGRSAPPEYDSLFGKLKGTRSSSTGGADFMKKIAYVLCSTIACTIVSLILLGLPISMVVIGAIYKDDCRVERFIPIYLIVAGSFGIVRTLCCARKGIKKDESEEAADENAKDYGAIIDLFLFAWLICGSVWVYRIYPDGVTWTVTESPLYCQETVYKFAFGMITATWSLAGLMLCCGCCLCIFGAASG